MGLGTVQWAQGLCNGLQGLSWAPRSPEDLFSSLFKSSRISVKNRLFKRAGSGRRPGVQTGLWRYPPRSKAVQAQGRAVRAEHPQVQGKAVAGEGARHL